MAAKKKSAEDNQNSGYYAYEGLNRVLHEKARLGILTALIARAEGLLFTELRQLCSMTDGNLSRHIHTLQEASLVDVWKGQAGKRPQTLVRLTAVGRNQFLFYLEELERVIRDAKRKPSEAKGSEFDAPPGWLPA